MSSVANNALAPATLLSGNAIIKNNDAASVSSNATPATSGSTFGPAVTVDLSAAAQAAVSGQARASQPVSGAPPAGGGGAPAGGSGASAGDTAALIAEAKAKVAAEIGVQDANYVVDSNGNIDQVALVKIEQQQAAAKAQASANGNAASPVSLLG